MFFLVVGVYGSVARDSGRHFFDGVGGGGDDGAVGFLTRTKRTSICSFAEL